MKLFCKKCEKIFSAEKNNDSEAKCPFCGAEQVFPELYPGPGTVVGDFLIEKSLSKGGMGEVFVARQISLDRPVALKVLQKEYTKDREYIDSLFREARSAAKINHPNIVQAYAVGEDEGIFYFAMELVRGDTMKAVLKREGVLDFKKAAKVICDIAQALDVAWKEQKLVHQDIKPDNIMLDNNSGMAKLADLGLAKTGNTDMSDDDSDEVFGTPQYISPEQLTGVPTDVRSDIYSLGATFFQFVTGRFPYVAATAEELAHMHNAGNLEPPKTVNPQIPDELNRIIMKMMARNINERYQDAAELVDDIKEYLRTAGDVESKKVRKLFKFNIFGKKNIAEVVPETIPADESGKSDEIDSEKHAGVKSKKILKTACFVLAGIIVLAVIAAGTIGILRKINRLPESLKPFAEYAFGWIDKVSDTEKDSETTVAVNEPAATQSLPKTASDVPVEPPAEKKIDPPRAEYKNAVDQALAGSVDQIDASWHFLSEPKNESETTLFLKVVDRFGNLDETERVEKSRRRLFDVFRQNRERNIQNQLAVRREAERIRKEEEQQRRYNERIRKEEELRRREEMVNQRKQVFDHARKCLLALSKMAETGKGETQFNETMDQAKFFLDCIYDPVPEAKVLTAVLKELPGKKDELQKAFDKFRKVSAKNNIYFSADRKHYQIAGLYPGRLMCIDKNDQTVEIDIFSTANKNSFFNALKNYSDLDDAEVYFYLFNGRTPPAAAASGRFWKKYLQLK